MKLKLGSRLDSLFYDNEIQEEYYLKMREKSSSTSAFVVGIVAAVGGFLYGYDTGLINDIMEMDYVTSTFPSDKINGFNVHERALITAILSLGTFFGALTAPIISDNFGRKFSIMISSGALFTLGNILQISTTGITLLCIGRFVSGVAVGNLSAIVPLYQAEASPKWVRGSVVYLYQWAITWGLLVASAICQGTKDMKSSASYRIPIGLQFLFALILCGGMLFLPESPRYYVQKDKLEKALQSLSQLRRIEPNDADLIEELVEIKASYDYEMSFGKTKLIDCFRNGGGRNKQVLRMITGMGVHVFQQCSGINFIFYYGVNFFSSTGVHDYYLMSFITYAVNTAFTIPGILLIEIIGRRKLLLGGGLGMGVSNLLIGILGVTVSNNNDVNSKICIAFSCVFIAFFAASWGGCCWALTSDLYGISIRQKAISLTVSTNWIVNFVFAFITPYLIDTGEHTAALGNKIFFMWGGFNLLGTVFVYFMVYETKGLKLEEVDYMYKVCNSPRDSTRFQSTKIEYENIDLYRFDNDNGLELEDSFGMDIPQPSDSKTSETSSIPKDKFPQDLPRQDQYSRQEFPRQDPGDPPKKQEQFPNENFMVETLPGMKDITIIPYTNLSPTSSKSDFEQFLDRDKHDSLKSAFSKKYESSQTTVSDLGASNIITPFFNEPPSSDSDTDTNVDEDSRE